MSNTTDRLNTLNVLRATVGKPALKSWKESAAKLEAAIATFSSSASPITIKKIPATAPELVVPAKRNAKIVKQADTAVKTDTPALSVKVPARKVGKKATTRTARTSTGGKSTDAFFALLKTLKLDAKQARATLRRKGFNAPYDATADVKAALASDARKK